MFALQTLDLTNPKTFRDLSKPMGAQSEARLTRFIERYRYFEDPTGMYVHWLPSNYTRGLLPLENKVLFRRDETGHC